MKSTLCPKLLICFWALAAVPVWSAPRIAIQDFAAVKTGAGWSAAGLTECVRDWVEESGVWEVVKGASSNVLYRLDGRVSGGQAIVEVELFFYRGDEKIAEEKLVGPRGELGVSVPQALQEMFGREHPMWNEIYDQAFAPRPWKDDYALLLFGRGADALKKQQFLTAEQNLRRSISIDPSNSSAFRLLGEVLEKSGSPRKARAFYEKGLALAPGNFSTQKKLANVYQVLGDTRQAKAIYSSVLEKRPAWIETRYRLAKLQWHEKEFELAEKNFQQILSRDPNHLLSHRDLSQLYAETGRASQASHHLERVVALRPGDDSAWVELAATHRLVGNTRGAENAYREVLKRSRNNVQALRFLADIAEARGEFEQAIILLKKSIFLEPKAPQGHLRLARIHAAKGDLVSATTVAQYATAVPGVRERAEYLLAIFFAARQQVQAEWYFNRVGAAFREDPTYYYNYALVLARKGALDRALRTVRDGLDIAPRDVDLLYTAGVLSIEKGDYLRAHEYFDRAVASDPGHPEALANLKWICRRLQKKELEKGRLFRRIVQTRFAGEPSWIVQKCGV